ncbi:MAG: MOSC domain-containing protein [bacterium]|nr:MOSC domain-containing protein [bacterium]
MKRGTLRFVCTSLRKGMVKLAVDEVRAVAGHGLEGDAHAGDWHRQVSLLGERDINGMRARGLELDPGAFGENLVVEGLDLEDLGIGSRLRIGEVELEISQIGKVCHTRCAIYHRTGDCIMPRAGLFAKVLSGGELRSGLDVEVENMVSRKVTQAAVLTVSDSCAAGQAEDTAGPAVAELVAERLAANIAWAGVEADDSERLVHRLRDLCGRRLDLVLTAGGTGCAPRDVTPEATRDVIDREVPGLTEAMRGASERITPRALLQRGVAGIRKSTLIVNLPGSRKAALENLKVVLPALDHAIQHLRGFTVHENDPRQAPQPVALSVMSGAFRSGPE